MTRHVHTRIRYDGPALADHEMDVRDLAPALLAVADIVQIANRKFNGDAAIIRVMVDADVEQQCFQLDLSLVQSFLDQAATFLGQKDVATAKEIAEWIGLIGGPTLGLFALLKSLYVGRDSSPTIIFRVGDRMGTTIIGIDGESTEFIVATQTAQLLSDPDVVKNVRGVLKPLETRGYEELAFIDDKTAVARIERDVASRIVTAPPIAAEDDPEQSVAVIRSIVRIKSAQYEGGARWSLMWNGRAIDAEMIGTATDWVSDFQANRISAPPNTILDVSMTETVRLDHQGAAIGKPSYQVSQVHKVTPPPVRSRLPF